MISLLGVKYYYVLEVIHRKVGDGLGVFNVVWHNSLSFELFIDKPFDLIIVHIDLNLHKILFSFGGGLANRFPRGNSFVDASRRHDFPIIKMISDSFIGHFSLLNFRIHVDQSNLNVVKYRCKYSKRKFEFALDWQYLVEKKAQPRISSRTD